MVAAFEPLFSFLRRSSQLHPYTSLQFHTYVISLNQSSPNSLRTTPGTIIIYYRLFMPHLYGSKYKDLSHTHLLHIAKDAHVPGEGMGVYVPRISEMRH